MWMTMPNSMDPYHKVKEKRHILKIFLGHGKEAFFPFFASEFCYFFCLNEIVPTKCPQVLDSVV